MNHPSLFVIGCTILGWLLVEVLAVIAANANGRIPVMMNVLGAISGFMISAGMCL